MEEASPLSVPTTRAAAWAGKRPRGATRSPRAQGTLGDGVPRRAGPRSKAPCPGLRTMAGFPRYQGAQRESGSLLPDSGALRAAAKRAVGRRGAGGGPRWTGSRRANGARLRRLAGFGRMSDTRCGSGARLFGEGAPFEGRRKLRPVPPPRPPPKARAPGPIAKHGSSGTPCTHDHGPRANAPSTPAAHGDSSGALQALPQLRGLRGIGNSRNGGSGAHAGVPGGLRRRDVQLKCAPAQGVQRAREGLLGALAHQLRDRPALSTDQGHRQGRVRRGLQVGGAPGRGARRAAAAGAAAGLRAAALEHRGRAAPGGVVRRIRSLQQRRATTPRRAQGSQSAEGGATGGPRRRPHGAAAQTVGPLPRAPTASAHACACLPPAAPRTWQPARRWP